jgi:hypothetical protein
MFSKETKILAICIAILPPLWAVLAPYIGVNTGAVALICAGLYVANGNKLSDGLRITAGFLLGDVWALIAVRIMEFMNLNPNVELFCTLCILGALAVLIAGKFEKLIFLPAWLCGWAIGLTVLTMVEPAETVSYFIQVAVAMIAGVWYVGAFLHAVQNKLMSIRKEGNENE